MDLLILKYLKEYFYYVKQVQKFKLDREGQKTILIDLVNHINNHTNLNPDVKMINKNRNKRGMTE